MSSRRPGGGSVLRDRAVGRTAGSNHQGNMNCGCCECHDSLECIMSHPCASIVNRARSHRRTTPPSPAKSLSDFSWRHPQSRSSAVRYVTVTVPLPLRQFNPTELTFRSVFRALTSAAPICPDSTCVTSTSRWPTSAAAIWRTPTCAAPTWSGRIYPEPTWT